MEIAIDPCSFDNTLRFLESVEINWDLEAPVKVQVHTLKLKARFLKAFFTCTGKWYINNNGLKAILRQVEDVVLSADQELQPLSLNLIPDNLVCSISSALEKLDPIKPLIQEVYALVAQSTRSISSTTDAVVGLIDTTLGYLKDLLKYKAQSIANLKKETEALEENLRYLGYLLRVTKKYLPREHDDRLRDVLIHSEAAADSTACLMYLCLDNNKMDERMLNEVKLQLSYLQHRIEVILPDVRKVYLRAWKASSSLQKSDFSLNEILYLESLGKIKEILQVSVSVETCVMQRINALEDEFKILRDYLMDTSAQEYTDTHPKLKHLFLQIKHVMGRAACVIPSFIDNDVTEDTVRQLDLDARVLLEEFKVIKQEARDIYDSILPKSQRTKFPTTNELGFVDFVIQNAKQLLHSKDDFIALLWHQIEMVHDHILSMRGDFIEIAKHPREHQDLKDPWTRFKDVVYHIDYVVDSFLIKDQPLWYHKLGLFYAIEDIKIISREVSDIKDRTMNHVAALKFSSNVAGISSQANSGEFQVLSRSIYGAGNEANKPGDFVELFEDEAKKIMEQLTNGIMPLQILSVMGMPGIGKTTLVHSIFENPSVLLHFHVRARCCVTQVYQKRRLLLEVLQQVSKVSYKVLGMTDDRLALKLYQSLKGKRYLIFVDDLWDIWPWNDMKASFPDDNNGSRIVFTSRFHNITSQITTNSITIFLNPISDLSSWELLQVKLFKQESCPQELFGIGQQIAANCKGLPIAVDLIAGLLGTKDRKKESWKQIANGLNAHLLEDQNGQCMGMLELSYDNLPNHLKPCFLYFGTFCEDIEVPTSKLIRLWIAEGFVELQKDDKGSLEGAAQKYLNDLIARSLVIISKKGSRGGVKASRVHDLLRDFALAKAKEESFLLTTNGFEQLSSVGDSFYEPYRLSNNSGSDYFPRSSLNPAHLAGITQIQLYFGLPLPACHVYQKHVAMGVNPCPRTRSMVYRGSILRKVSFSFDNFKLLRVLDIWAIDIDYCPNIFELVNLRFLSLNHYRRKSIPPEIGNLRNLETLMLGKNHKIDVPTTVWNLVKLKHLLIRGSYTLPPCSQEFLEKPFKLHSLQSLSTPDLAFGEDTEQILRGLCNLRKLSCRFLYSWDYTSNCIQFPNLDFLTQLESLKVAYRGKALHKVQSCKFSFPANVKKLTLSGFCLPWTEISSIGNLPNLQVLKLLDDAFEGTTWDMNEGEFRNLSFLKLERLQLLHWNAFEDHLPSLKTVVLVNCKKLVEIPPCLGDIPTLQSVELRGCSHSCRCSLGVIKERQIEMGNEELAVTLG